MLWRACVTLRESETTVKNPSIRCVYQRNAAGIIRPRPVAQTGKWLGPPSSEDVSEVPRPENPRYRKGPEERRGENSDPCQEEEIHRGAVGRRVLGFVRRPRNGFIVPAQKKKGGESAWTKGSPPEWKARVKAEGTDHFLGVFWVFSALKTLGAKLLPNLTIDRFQEMLQGPLQGKKRHLL